MNAGMVLSIGVFFSLMIAGLAATLPTTMKNGLVAQGVPEAVATHAAETPPVASLFAAFLGYNPMAELIPKDVLATLPAENAARITGKEFFPNLISGPFMHGLTFAFTFSLVLYLLAAIASWMGGRKYVHQDVPQPLSDGEEVPAPGE
jgi:hypothetical protein